MHSTCAEWPCTDKTCTLRMRTPATWCNVRLSTLFEGGLCETRGIATWNHPSSPEWFVVKDWRECVVMICPKGWNYHLLELAI